MRNANLPSYALNQKLPSMRSISPDRHPLFETGLQGKVGRITFLYWFVCFCFFFLGGGGGVCTRARDMGIRELKQRRQQRQRERHKTTSVRVPRAFYM